jgi:DNA-binding transcriptional LysR family regulator
VIREGTLTGAARALSLTQPSVSRHMDALEEALGATLFIRTRSGLTPTPLARSLIPHAEAMSVAADNLVRAASGEREEMHGTVRITASDIVGTFVLPPILTTVRRQHPEIEIELVLSNRNSNLLFGEADIAVRMLRPEQEAVVARHVGEARVGLFAHKRYVASTPLPRSAGELLTHPLIGVDRDIAVLAGVSFEGRNVTREMFSFRCDSDAAQMMALKAGFGIGACHLGIAADDPDLIRVLPDGIEFGYEMWVAMHENLRSTRRVRAVFDHVVEGMIAYSHKR